ncbi:protein-serine O-palmitoleoyltransferase porcupine isoform X2 [Bacillus rossius redtenbacheri]|uniref:protein-serine O-palmitoleoyltransferase porcupine isoform X2 n=1 Tax=Bacillus rossius redtenbacheri TaxID=93214 RepID=UPI002FDEB1CC
MNEKPFVGRFRSIWPDSESRKKREYFHCSSSKIFGSRKLWVKIPDAVCHMTSAVTGVMALHYFFSLMTTVIIAFAVVAYVCLYLVSMYLKKNRGPIMGIISVAFLFVCELFLISETDWHKVRGSQMLLAMKAISLAFDTDYGVLHHLPSFLEFMGYVLCAGTSIFGPWIPYRDYVAAFNKPKWDTRWLWKVFVNTLAAFIFISLSSCWVDWLLPNTLWRWWIAYRDALSFRTSHYFVSFLSEASAIMSGLGNNGESSWTLPVARPLYIEIPRSLVQVVVYWNIPMHNWLKTYVFRTTRHFGNFAAVLSTYAVSSLLHGLNFQLSAVLLSLGTYTYIEYLLRQKLSTIFSACIQVRPCRKDCAHRNKEMSSLVILINIFFGLIAAFHLAYLGVMFNVTSTLQERGYSYFHTLSKWGDLSFASHWLAFATYFFYFLV